MEEDEDEGRFGEPLFIEGGIRLSKLDTSYELGNGFCLSISKFVLKSYKTGGARLSTHHTFHGLDVVNGIIESGSPKLIGFAWVYGNFGCAYVSENVVMFTISNVVNPMICYTSLDCYMVKGTNKQELPVIMRLDPFDNDFVAHSELTKVWLDSISPSIVGKRVIFASGIYLVNNHLYITYQHEDDFNPDDFDDTLNYQRIFVTVLNNSTRYNNFILSASGDKRVVSVINMSTQMDILVTNESVEFICRDTLMNTYRIPKLKNNLKQISRAQLNGDLLVLYCKQTKTIYDVRINLRKIYEGLLEELKTTEPEVYTLMKGNSQFLDNIQKQLLLL